MSNSSDASARARRILAASRKERSESRIVTVPNCISVLRLIVLVPIFVVVLLGYQQPGWALVVAIILGLTDFLDGFIARKFHQVTNLGRVLDPVADRLSQVAVSVTMVIAGLIPWWMAVIVAAADLLLGISLVTRRSGFIPVRWIGRIRTAILMIGLPAVLFVAALGDDPIWRKIVLTFVAVGVLLHAIADTMYAWSVFTGTAQKVKDAHPDAE